ncbi:Na+/H+ antiporter subunit E [Wenzhouxiangella sp. XN24]|uniref:Na+/H+ antiporter subunit E n=1 Tax=Wenzhouxiangella sp. XN24 TaxID=2713569 RepID=UPI0013ED8976|nr:Na+/H+ antiporter subunit E [Wenzhouxiangella sp. XN24]NGX15123.1 Na+/H+ antiporter subunit E [Wenzhouxiangella sp. XN24]
MPANTRHAPAARDPARWQDGLRRVLLFAVLWWILAEGAVDSLAVGVPFVLLGAWLSLVLWGARSFSLRGLARFLPWFAYQSLAGATDVAMRAFRPAMPLHPGLVHCRLRLPTDGSRIALADVVSMLPGTLSADLDGEELVIHALDTRRDMQAMVTDLEPRIAALFGLDASFQEIPENAS